MVQNCMYYVAGSMEAVVPVHPSVEKYLRHVSAFDEQFLLIYAASTLLIAGVIVQFICVFTLCVCVFF